MKRPTSSKPKAKQVRSRGRTIRKARASRKQAPARSPARTPARAPARSARTVALMEAMRPALGPEPVKVPRGRPPEYDPRFCDLLMEHMAHGLSFESFAGVIGVCKKTLYNWTNTKEYAPFLHAKERGTELMRLWWEKLGIQGVQGLGPRVLAEENETTATVMGRPVFDSEGNPILKIKRKYAAAQFVPGTWFRNMTNRFPLEWRDRHELTGKDGKDLLPPQVPWDTLVSDPHVQQFMAERARMLGQAAAGGAGAHAAQPKPARKPSPVEPVKPV